jgi:SNF2 family DNA or RNA helicase
MRQFRVVDDGKVFSLTFDYDEDVLALVKGIPSRFGRKIKGVGWVWEVPYNQALELEYVCSRVQDLGYWNVETPESLHHTAARDRLIQKCFRARKIEEIPEVIAAHRSRIVTNRSPREHQTVATAAILYAGNYFICDEMGVGKTKEVIDAIWTLMNEGAIEKAVIVCPKILKPNWVEEIGLNCGQDEVARVVVVPNKATPSKRRKAEELFAYDPGMRWIIYNYEQTWRTDASTYLPLRPDGKQRSRFEEFCNGAFVVFDEAQKLCNPKSKQGEMAAHAAELAANVVPMTGTPVMNKADDMHALSNVVSMHALGHSLGRFHDLYAEQVFNGFGHVTKGYKDGSDKLVVDKISRFTMRRKREECLQLPPMIEKKLYIPLSQEQADAYIALREELKAVVSGTDLSGDDSVLTVKAKVDSLLIRLQQITSGYISDGKSSVFFEDGGAKFELMDELVQEICGDNEDKVVIWSRFVAPIRFIAERYKQYDPVMIYGDVPDGQRQKNIDRFKKDPSCKIFVAQIQTAGLGLNLVECAHQIFLTRWWNNAINDQAESRLQRMGQLRNVNVFDLITVPTERMTKLLAPKRGSDQGKFLTIDQILDRVLASKQKVSDMFTGDLSWSTIQQIAGV